MPETPARFDIHLPITEDNGDTVTLLATASLLSKQRIKQAMHKGAVWLTRGSSTKRLRRTSRPLLQGDTLHLYYNEQLLATEASAPLLIADEGDYSVWYKPYGMLSQGSRWGDHTTINRWVEQHLTPQRPAFIVHRLDRAATGLILIAHKRQSAAALAELFQQRALEKRYRVIVHDQLARPEAELIIEEAIEGRSARSRVRQLEYDEPLQRALLEVTIESGRKHQIRRHLASIGLPVVGDRLYGRDGDIEDLQLSACFLAFRTPWSDEERVYRLPEAMQPQLRPTG